MDELRQSFESIREKLKDLFNRVNQLEAAPTVTSGSGGGAPVDAQYLVLAFNGTLTQERRLDFSARFATTDGGANADYDVDLAASGVGAGIYGSATQVPQITVDTYGRITNVANVAITGFVTGSGSAGRVAYWNGISSITGEDALWYDAGNNRLGVNDNTPSYTLDVNGIIGINGIQTVYNAGAIAGFTGTYYFGNGGGSLSFLGGLDGYYVTAVGNNALLSNTTGYRNTAIGNGALNALTTGYHNTAIGATSGNAVITNNNCVCIGYSADVSADGTTYETVIGSGVTGNGSNTITIGSGIGMTATYLGGNVVIEEDKYVGRLADVRILFDATAGYIDATLGDAAGSDKFRIIDSGTALVASIDSNGNGYFYGNVGIGTTASRRLHVYELDAATNSITYLQRLSHSTSGLAAAGFGLGTEEELEDAGGTMRIAEIEETLWTDAAAATYTANRVWKIPNGGAAAAESLRLAPDRMTKTGIGGNTYIRIESGGDDAENVVEFYNNSTYMARTGYYPDIGAGTGGAILDSVNGEDAAIMISGVPGLYIKNTTLRVGIGSMSPSGKCTIDQSSNVGAIPVLELDQADDSEEMINFIVAGTGAGYPVDTATAVGAAYARLRVAVNGTFKYIQLYNA